jgi:hypothetical protein
MTTWSTRYVRLRDRDADLARLKKETGLAEPNVVADSHSFAAIVVATPSLQPDDLGALSRSFSEAFSIQVHSVADLVIYDHWRDGARARGFTYAGEAGWVRVVGEPEAWEAAFFFAPAKLKELLQELEDDCTDDAVLERETGELQKLFSGAKLVEGSTRPAVAWRPMAQAVARHYGFPDPSPASATSSAKIPRAT